MLILDQKLHAKITSLAEESYPYEGCGLLIGLVENDNNSVHAAIPVPNVWPVEEERRIRFRIDELDLLNAELHAASRGLDVIGIFHSHPDHPPIASERDLAWATWPGYSYLITEVRQGRSGQQRAWQLLPDRSGFDEEKIEIRE